MANFKQHIIGSSVASGVISTTLFSLGYFDSKQATFAFLLGTFAGLMPDLDSDTSKPLKATRDLLSILIAFVVVYFKCRGYSIVEMAIVWTVVFIFIRNVVFNFFMSVTVHRGMFHSIPSAIVSGLLFVNILYYLLDFSAMLSWVFSSFIFLGYIVHLILDEFVSLNLMGESFKKSLGTALKFYNKKDLKTSVLIYILLAGLFYIAPTSFEYNEMISDKTIYKDMLNNIFPKGEWFKGFL